MVDPGNQRGGNQRGEYRDRPNALPLEGQVLTRALWPYLHRLQQAIVTGTIGQPQPTFSVYGGSAGIGLTNTPLGIDGGNLVAGEPGVPIPTAMTARRVSVAFMSDNVPAGGGVATLWRRRAGGTFTREATFPFTTS